MSQHIAPSNIRLFERLQITSIVIGMVHAFAASQAVLDPIWIAALMVALTLWVSRKRSNFARWLLLVFFLGGLILMLMYPSAIWAQGYPVITIGVAVLQALALALLFTKQSNDWLNGTSEGSTTQTQR